MTPYLIASDIVEIEGGYVNDPDDPGGPTKYGVTLNTLSSLGYDLDGDGVVTANDVALITKDLAVDIFLDHYFYEYDIDQLPETLQASVFDMCVNSGRNGIKILQQMFVDKGYECDVDGFIGPQTTTLASLLYQESVPYALVDAYGEARREYYYNIADKNPKLRKFAKTRDGGKGGWIKRAEKFIISSRHYTDKQHQDRTKHW